MKWLKKVVSGLARLFSDRTMGDVEAGIELVRFALPIVKQIAAATPTRSDDEIVRLFQEYGLPLADQWLSVPKEERGRALMHVAAEALKRVAPGYADRVIDFAVQSAVLEAKNV